MGQGSQFTLGGASNVRAYNPSEYQSDSGVFATFEYSFAAPGFDESEFFKEGLTWGDVLQVSFFMDYGWALVNDPSSTDEAVIQLYGGGFERDG